jgi:hypothetical protein
MRLFAIRTGRDKLTDAEYIEQVRKKLRVPRWLRYLFTAIGIAGIVVSGCAVAAFFKILGNFAAAAGVQPNLVFGTFFLSCLFGYLVGQWFHGAIHHIAQTWCEPRKDQLLVNCWDAMNHLLDEASAAAGPLEQVTKRLQSRFSAGNALSAGAPSRGPS